MGRRGSSEDWGDARDSYGPRSERGGPPNGGYGRDDGRGRARLSSAEIGDALREAQQLQQDGQLDDAIALCEELLDNPDYALSCYYALGQCARAEGNIEQAASYFDEAVDRVNLDALNREESDQLLQLCQEAADGARPVGGNIPQRGGRGKTASPSPTPPPPDMAPTPDADFPPMGSSAHLAAVSGGFDGSPDDALAAAGLGGAGSVAPYYSSTMPPATAGDQLSQLINNLGSGISGVRAGVGTLPEPQRAQVTAAVRDIENYVAHGLLTAAIEECLRVMELAPQYLDVHLMLGEIYVRQGKIEQAIAKYAVLIDIYLANNRIDDAISTYRRILQLEPNNLTYRVKLLELLKTQGRTEDVQNERML